MAEEKFQDETKRSIATRPQVTREHRELRLTTIEELRVWKAHSRIWEKKKWGKTAVAQKNKLVCTDVQSRTRKLT